MVSTLVLVGMIMGFGLGKFSGPSPEVLAKASLPTPNVQAAAVAPSQERAAAEDNAPVVARKVTLNPVTEDDHVRGPADAKVTIVEFSDMECPFCRIFHQTMKQLLTQYPSQVRWVYRHYPLDDLHTKSRKEAEATECAAELGGNEKFWAYIDRVFEVTPSNDQLDSTELPKIATQVGLDANKFQACLNSGKYAQKVQSQLVDATTSGGRGTPHSIIINDKGEQFVLGGALPLALLKEAVEKAMR